jgi:hypothetical protein
MVRARREWNVCHKAMEAYNARTIPIRILTHLYKSLHNQAPLGGVLSS